MSTGDEESRPPELTGEPPRSSGETGSPNDDTTGSKERLGWRDTALRWISIEPFWYGPAALALALIGQRILTPGQDVSPSPNFAAAKVWYIAAVAVILFGWWDTYNNHSLLARGRNSGWNVVVRLRNRTNRIRLGVLAFAAVANIVAIAILSDDWYSFPGGWLWALSMVVVVLAFLGEHPDVASVDEDVESEKYGWRISRWIEAVVVLAILILALIMRAWRLGDLRPGMHGDEGEAGVIGLAILHGIHISPFLRGWFTHSNIYFWSVALCMRIFGTGLVGLRSWAVICGLVTVLFVYLITREMFGVRAAIIAGFFLAFQSADILMSRQLSSNAATPAFTAAAFYCLVRGLRTKKHIYFAGAGLISGFSVYYFAGGRILAPSILVFIAYLSVIHRAFLHAYWTRVVTFVAAALAAASPFLAYNFAYPLPPDAYPNDRFIWLHHSDLAALYGSYDWRTIVWDQLQRTLSIFTWASDASNNHILDYPIARPLEAALIVLGSVWAAWRWKDSRFMILLVWFWSSVIVGGVLTTDAPNVPRMVGMLPVLSILIAAWLEHFGAQLQAAISKLTPSVKRLSARTGAASWLSGAAIGSFVLVSGFQNWDKYINYYLHTHTQPDVTEQAIYVQDIGAGYRYYDLGTPAIFFTHGDNRFINPHADGIDVLNPSNIFPITDNGATGEKDVDFMVWGDMYQYLPVLRAYYPEGRQQSHPFGDPQFHYPPLVTYLVTHEQIDRHRMVHASFVPSHGAAVRRAWPVLGLVSVPPAGLTFPSRAVWTGAIVAPVYGSYRFQLAAPPGTELEIDRSRISIGSDGGSHLVTLAQGVHAVRLSANLPDSSARVIVEWAVPGSAISPIDRQFLWDGHIGSEWSGQITTPATGITLSRRADGFLGFRTTQLGIGTGSPFNAAWTSDLRVSRPGSFSFWLNSNGSSTLTIDGKAVIGNPGDGKPHVHKGSVQLGPGVHRLVVGYSWRTGVGYLEAWWAPPGSRRQFLISPELSPP